MACVTERQDYSYALNKQGDIVNISEAIRGDKYKCPCCGFGMVPHMGKVRKWHFAHKAGATCNYETYLHKVAKARIRQAYLSSEKFIISFNPLHVCSADCPIKKDSKCERRSYREFDIREYYDECKEEATFDGFRADLLLRSSLHPDREPIFLEIHVSHKSSEKKITSGHRIIEITIETEEDINAIISNSRIEGVHSKSRIELLEDAKCVFYNFNRTYPIKPSEKLFVTKYYFAFKEFNQEYHEIQEMCYCFESVNTLLSAPNYNIIISTEDINRFWAYAEFEKRGLNIISCQRCVFYNHFSSGYVTCSRSKRYGTPKAPQYEYARKCPHYKVSNKDDHGTPIYQLAPSYDAYCEIIMPDKKK